MKSNARIVVKTGKKWAHSRAKEAHTTGALPGFCSMKQLRVLLLLPVVVYLHAWVEKDSVGFFLI